MTRRITRRAVLADASVLYALVDPSDQNNQLAQSESRLLMRESYRVMVAYPTLLEAYALILHRLKTRVALRWLTEVRTGTDLLSVLDSDYQDAMQLAKRYDDQIITLHDLTLSVLSNKLSLPIWTFDADFDILGATVWRGPI